MRDNLRVQQTGASNARLQLPDMDSPQTGRMRGEVISVADAEPDVDDAILMKRIRQNSGLEGIIENKPLQSRSIGLDQRSSILSTQQLKTFSQASGNNQTITKKAIGYLKYFLKNESKPQLKPSNKDLMQHYAGLQKLAVSLKSNDQDFVAQLTPIKGGASDLGELCEKLRDAGDDPSKLEELLEELESMPEEKENLIGMMKTLRFQPEQLKRKLRETQKLPEPTKDEKEALLEQVEDEIRELEQQGGSQIRAVKNALDSAGKSDQPEVFLQTYPELLHKTEGFVQTLETLLNNYKPSELLKILPLMKQTVIDDLGSDSELRSVDKIKLEALQNELAHMQISSTFLDLVSNFVSSMKRLYSGKPA